VAQFLLLLDTTSGRDKLCRLVQYTSKALKWRAEVDSAVSPQEDRVKMYGELMAAMSLTRKVLRFFKTLAVLRQLRAAIPADTSSDTSSISLAGCVDV